MSIQKYSVNQHPIQMLLTLIKFGIPGGMEDKDIKHYDEFLQERRKLLALKIKNYYWQL